MGIVYSESNTLELSIIEKQDGSLFLRALMDTICAISSCLMDLNISGGDKITDIVVKIYEE